MSETVTKLERTFGRLTLAQRFGLASLAVIVLGLIGIGAWVQQQVESGIIRGTAATTALYVESFVEPQLGELAEGKPVSPQHLKSLARLLYDTPLGKQIVAFKLWGPNGFVLYDTDQASIGKRFPVEPRLVQAWQGQTTSRLSSLDGDENAPERKIASQLLETYSPVHAANSDRTIAVAEFYQRSDELQADIAGAERSSWLVVAGAMLLIYLLLTGFVRRASDTIEAQQAALTVQVTRLQELLAQNDELGERVRRGAAQTAAINERFLRRISAELHDGPAQDLSLALLRMDPDEDDGRNGAGVVAAGNAFRPIRESVNRALQEIRNLSSGLGLPELDPVTLPEAIRRAVRGYERRTGGRVAVRLEAVPTAAPLAVKITAYRLIQEGLTNAYRHAGGAGLEVHATESGGQLCVEVCDAGPGFDAVGAFEGDGHLGLLGMRERVQSLGGTFAVDSRPGKGTVLRAWLPLGLPEEGVYD